MSSAKGRKYTDIAKMLLIPKTTVGDIIMRYGNEDRVEFVPPPGRPKKLTDKEERAIVRKIKNNSRLTAPKIAAQVNEEWNKHVSPQTIRRTLKSNDFNGRVARRQPYISEVGVGCENILPSQLRSVTGAEKSL